MPQSLFVLLIKKATTHVCVGPSNLVASSRMRGKKIGNATRPHYMYDSILWCLNNTWQLYVAQRETNLRIEGILGLVGVGLDFQLEWFRS